MLSKISAADHGPRFLTGSARKTTSRHGRTGRRKETNVANKRTPLTLFQTALEAHGDIGQPNNDDVADPELDEDWRAVRAKLVSMERGIDAVGLSTSWAHEIAQPEKGCLLVCRREGLGFFHRSLVLILSHDDAKATVGLVLNSPSPSLLESAFARGWSPGKFVTERIYFGGPVEMNSLHLLHSHGELDKCKKVIEGVYMGGFEDAQSKVEAGHIPPEDFKLLVGYSSPPFPLSIAQERRLGWGPYQLAREIEDGCWFVLSCSVDLILEKASENGMSAFNEAAWKRVLELSGFETPF